MMNIYAWRVSDMLAKKRYEQLNAIVTKERAARAARFYREIDTCRSLMGEAMIRLIASADLSRPVSAIQFEHSQYGKPELADSPRYRFNVSHSGDWVVSITSHYDKQIGIDVEQIGELDEQVAEAVFTDRELAALRSLQKEQQTPYFYRLWTMKESYIKALGTGLSMPLKQFSILKTETGYSGCGGGADTYEFRAYPLDERHKLSACSEGDALPDSWQLFDYRRFLLRAHTE